MELATQSTEQEKRQNKEEITLITLNNNLFYAIRPRLPRDIQKQA